MLDELNELKAEGNTIPPRQRLRKAVFTLNNYTVVEMNSMIHDFDLMKYEYIIGMEVGEEGTPHLQGYVEFKKQLYFSALKKINPRAHWEPAKGSREQNIVYCSKDNNYIKTFPKNRNERLLDKYIGVVWKQWQQDIIDIVETQPDDRTIYWYVDRVGNTGKSFLCKYLYLKYNCIIADGKKDNIFNQIKIWMDANEGEDPRLIIADVPRTNLDYINYGALESIKNGLVYSGKYEGGICAFDNPHIIVFANERPNGHPYSHDRLVIKEIK